MNVRDLVLRITGGSLPDPPSWMRVQVSVTIRTQPFV